MKDKHYFISILLILTLFLVACSQIKSKSISDTEISEDNNEEEFSEKFTAIIDPVRKTHNTYSIVMPGNWKEATAGMMVTYLPKEEEVADPLSEKIVVVVSIKSEEDARMPLAERVSIGMKDMLSNFPDLEYSINDDNARLDGLEAITFNFNASIQGKKIIYRQISARKNTIIYGIMHSCVENECAYTDIYNEMVSSFKAIDFVQ